MHTHLRLVALVLPVILLLTMCNASDRNAAPVHGRIVPAASMHDARAHHTATLLRDGRVLIAGGMVENGVILDSAELFDPATRRFEPLPKMKERRVGHTASLLPDGRVVIAGGSSGRELVDGNWRTVSANIIEIFDPVRRVFTEAGHLRVSRSSHGAVTLRDGRVVLLGGGNGDLPNDSVEIFDPRTLRSEDGGHLAAPREGCGCLLLKDERVLLSGGSRTHRELNGTYEIFDPATRSSRVVAQMRMPRRKHAAVLLDDGRALIVGGSDVRDWAGRLTSAEIFDPTTNKTTAVASMAKERFKISAAAVTLKDGAVLVAGDKPEAEIYEPSATRFFPVAGSMKGPHFFSTATLLSDGRVLITGGYGNGSAARGPASTQDTFLYEPK